MKIELSLTSFNGFLINLLVYIIAFRGLLENLWDIGTPLMDSICFIMLLSIFIWNRHIIDYGNKIVKHFVILCFFALIIVLIDIVIGRCSVTRGIIGYRGTIIYAIPFLITCMGIDIYQCKRIIRTISNMGLLLSVFGIIQYVFRNSLPKYLLTLHEIQLFGVARTNIIRATGLVGTTIDFGQMCVIFAGLAFAEILTGYNTHLINWFKLIAASVACVLSFGRAAMFGLVVVLIVIYIKNTSEMMTAKRLFFTITVLIIVFLVINYLMNNTIIFYRFSKANASEMTRNDLSHITVIQNAIEYIKRYPIIGYTVDLQRITGVTGSRIIADGTFWEYQVQWGVIFTFFLYALNFRIWRISSFVVREEDPFFKVVGISFYALIIELVITSIINSSWMFRGVYILCWILAGMVILLFYGDPYQTYISDEY